MATASTPLSNKYSWMASTSAFFSANINTCQNKQWLYIYLLILSGCLHSKLRFLLEAGFSGGTPAGTPSWPPLWHIPLPALERNKLRKIFKMKSVRRFEKLYSDTEKTYLDYIQTCSSGSAHVNSDRFDQSTLGKVLDLLWHSSTEK